MRAYEDAGLQAKARSVIPLAVLQDRARAKGGDPATSPLDFQDLLFM